MAISVIFDGVTVYPPGGSWPIKETHHSRLLKLLHKLGLKSYYYHPELFK
jgi:hypothetical protein